MGRYNLLDEKWIQVIRENGGQTEKVSLKELFIHTSDYYDLAGEMKTQDFAVLRVLIAVLQTVFSRFDSEGNPYDMIELDEETFQQLEPINREDLEDEDPFFETWLNLWKKGEFPEIVQQYLEAWRDHFYLFDDKFPFYQVTKGEMEQLVKEDSKGNHGTAFFGKNINRMISESGNKIALFSPIIGEAKEHLLNDQLVRWLIMYQGYSGATEKKKVRETASRCSHGWLYDLGGIYLKGKNLFETLMLNCILSTDFDEEKDGEQLNTQKPAWERSPIENVDLYFHSQMNNRTSLYTNWSKVVYFEQDYQEGTPFCCFAAKLPIIDDLDNFMEPMTCWQWNKDSHFTPHRHQPAEAVWRHFNVLMGICDEDSVRARKPGILSWYYKICENSLMSELNHFKVTICSVSMQDDGDKKSFAPADEIVDELQMETAVLVDHNQNGWLEQINTLITNSKYRIDKTLGAFLKDISAIRGYKSDDHHLENWGKEALYREIDRSFRDWLYEIDESDSMNAKALEWYDALKMAIQIRGYEIFRSANLRDLKGIKKDNKMLNIATAYNKFQYNIFVQFKKA